MADEKDTPEEKPEKKGGKLKLILMIGVPLLLAAGGAVFFLGGGDADAEAAATTTTVIVEGEVIEIDTLTVNLVGEEGRFARVGFAVVLMEGADTALVGGKIPLMRDAVLSIMTGYGSAELQTKAGMDRLRDELSDGMVALFPDGEVLRAVLTELIVQ